MELYEELLHLSSLAQFQESQHLLRNAALALMPADKRMIAQVSEYAGDAVLVSDLVEKLGLPKAKSIVVGKALSALGFRRTTVYLRSKPYLLWVKDTCRYPKYELSKILETNTAKVRGAK